MAAPSLVSDTLRALVAPRRLVPVLTCAVPLVWAQTSLSPEPFAGPLAAAMCLGFWLLAPLSWRALFPAGEPVRLAPLRLAAYGGLSAAFVGLVGVAVPWAISMGHTFLTDDRTLGAVLALYMVGGWGLAQDIDQEQGLLRARRRARELQREAERAQLLAMRSHLDPHFLFNTLNAIAEWCREDGETAERACLDLASMLRTVMAGVRAASWPLSREVALLETLLHLHLTRDPELFDLVREVEDPLPPVEVPPMILLPLAENAVKHGPAAGHRGRLGLRVQSLGERVVVEIDNPGPYGGRREGGEGLAMVEKRLGLAYGDDAELSVRGDGGRTIARVVVPRRMPEVSV